MAAAENKDNPRVKIYFDNKSNSSLETDEESLEYWLNEISRILGKHPTWEYL